MSQNFFAACKKGIAAIRYVPDGRGNGGIVLSSRFTFFAAFLCAFGKQIQLLQGFSEDFCQLLTEVGTGEGLSAFPAPYVDSGGTDTFGYVALRPTALLAFRAQAWIA